MVSITITIKNEAEVQGKLAALGVELRDFSKELSTAGQYLADYFSTVPFDTLGRNYGQQWPDVSPARLEYKLKHYPAHGHDTLQATGRMRDSFRFESARDYVRLYNTAEYFADHQLGLRNLPKRVMMAIDNTNRQAVVGTIERGIQEKINLVRG